MKTVLIALDYSPSAQKIAEMGYRLAKTMNARTILLHVIAHTTYYSSPGFSPILGFDSFSKLVETDTADELRELAKNYVDKLKEHLGGEMIDTAVRNGDFGEIILETATELNADIIVLGTHSRRGLDKILMGSVAEKVLHNSSIPLFIIPTKSTEPK